jgi:tetratricopeptide (TPR) repeat protein
VNDERIHARLAPLLYLKFYNVYFDCISSFLVPGAEHEVVAALTASKKYLEQVLLIETQRFDRRSVHILLARVLTKLVSSIRMLPQPELAHLTDMHDLTSLLQHALRLRVREQGWHHPDVWQLLHHAAADLEHTGHAQQASELLACELALRTAAVGTHHPATALVFQQLGKALLKAGQLAEAEATVGQALDLFQANKIIPRAIIVSLLHLSSAIHGLHGRHAEVLATCLANAIVCCAFVCCLAKHALSWRGEWHASLGRPCKKSVVDSFITAFIVQYFCLAQFCDSASFSML